MALWRTGSGRALTSGRAERPRSAGPLDALRQSSYATRTIPVRTTSEGSTTRSVSTTVDAAALRLAVARLARRLRQAVDSGITPSQLSALATLDRDGPLSLRDLAAAERVAPSTLTRVVAALEEQRLLERSTDVVDRRVSVVRVTATGARLLSATRDRGTQLLAARIAALDEDQTAALVAALPVLETLIEDER